MKTQTTHAHGLQADLLQLLAQQQDRRRAISLVAAGLGGLLPLMGCGGGEATVAAASGSASGGAASGSTGNCSVIPSETAGPFPGDGSNSVNGALANVLALDEVVRSDIRSSIGGLNGVAAGVPLSVTLTLVNTGNNCAALAGRAVYLWHCDREGRYSMYSSGVTNQNYLRGVQVTDAVGQVTFQTIVPACYSGRWPHIHFEVFSSLDAATRGANAVKMNRPGFRGGSNS
jgi:Dioxygenase